MHFPGFQGILRKSPKLPFVSPYTLYPLPCNAHAQCPHALVMQGCYLVLILTRTKSSSCILILTVRPKYLSLLCSIYCWSLWRVHYVVGNFLKPKPKHCYLTWQLDHSPKYSELATFFFLNLYGSPRLQTPYWLMYLEIAPPLMSQGSTDTVGCPYAWMWNLWARGDDCAIPFCIMDLSILKFSCLWESGRWRGVPGTNTPWMPMDECIQTFLNHSYMFHVTLAQLVPVEVASFDFSS